MKFLLSLAVAASGALASDLHLTTCYNTLGNPYTSIFYYDGTSAYCNVGSVIRWEAASTCTFDSGVTVTAWLDPNAASFDFQAGVGEATNGDEWFWCYKDNNHYFTGAGSHGGSTECVSNYYCVSK